jgi:hypothetical protein
MLFHLILLSCDALIDDHGQISVMVRFYFPQAMTFNGRKWISLHQH